MNGLFLLLLLYLFTRMLCLRERNLVGTCEPCTSVRWAEMGKGEEEEEEEKKEEEIERFELK